MELRELFAQLKYQEIAEILPAGFTHDNPNIAHQERFGTIMEAAKAIPAVHEANIGASQAEADGAHDTASILRAQSSLLTAIYRIAQEMGFQW